MAAWAIAFENPTFSQTDPRDRFDLLVGVEAALELSVAGRTIYTEPMFPIVELREALSTWMRAASADFEFVSMESDEQGLIWIRRQLSGRWRVGSIHQDDISPHELDTTDVLDGCRDFVARVDAWVRQELGVEAVDVLGR